MAVGTIVLLLVVLGTGTGFYLTQQSQDLRQQASDCIQECPGTDGVLRSCTPAEADGTATESYCNSAFIGNIASCNDIDFCCNGTNWTGDLTACTTTDPAVCNDLATVEDCDASTSPDCAWFYCVESCFSADTTLEEAGCDDECAHVYCEDGAPPGQLCNTECTVDTQCSNTDPDWSCDTTTNTCRLTDNPTSETCEEAVVTDAVSCGLTGTLTDGTTPSETTSMTYEITSTGGDLVTAVDFIIHGNFQDSGDWTKLSDDLTPKDGLFTGNTTYSEMVDLLVSSGHDRQQVVDEGIQFVAAVYGPQGYCAEWGKWSETDEDCTPCFGTIELKTTADTTNAVSCDSITGTLTDGTVVDETTELTYEVTSYGGDLIEIVQISIHGNFEGPGVSEGWVTLIREDNPTDNTLTSSTTYGEMIDLLVATGHDEQELIEKGIKYGVNVYGSEGRCKGDDTWSETGNSCTYNGTCDGTIALASSAEDDNDDDSSNDSVDTAIGCNDICVTNSDCQDTDHICVTTADGSNRCRLTAYTSSESCVIESSGDTTTDTTTQPSLPAELPESGPEDWLNWLKAGLVTMGIGTALFLLL